MLTRRQTLAGALGLSLTGLTACSTSTPKSSPSSSSTATMLDTFRVIIPTTLAFSAPMASFGSHGFMNAVAVKTTIDKWASVDALKSMLINGQAELAATPSYAGANLHTKGQDVRLTAITVWGMLYILGPVDASVDRLTGLSGKTIGVPLPGNMPDLVLSYLLAQNNLVKDRDIAIKHFQDSQEALNTFVQGRLDYVLLPEHAATVALAKSKSSGRAVGRVLDLQTEWAKLTGRQPRFPMAGVVMPGKLVDERPSIIGNVLNELDASIKEVNAATDTVISKISQNTKLEAGLVKQVIPRLQLSMVPALKARPEIEDFYTRISTVNAGIIGGKLPSDKFYLPDPR